MTKQELELKNYLQEALVFKKILKKEIERLAELREMTSYVKSPSYNAYKCDGGKQVNELEETVIKIIDFEEKVGEKIKILYSKIAEREQLISKIGEALTEEILKLRYLDGEKLKKVAEILGYDERQICRLQIRGLSMLVKFYKK